MYCSSRRLFNRLRFTQFRYHDISTSLQIVDAWQTQGYPTDIGNFALKSIDFPLLQLLRKDYKYHINTIDIIKAALTTDDEYMLKLLKWAVDAGYMFTYDDVDKLGALGRIELVKYLWDNVKNDATAHYGFERTIMAGHLDVIKWLHEHKWLYINATMHIKHQHIAL